MVTKEQAMVNSEFHYTGRHDCRRIVGPRGGIKEIIARVRASGKCQTWKRDQERFRLPVKHGLYGSYRIDDNNAGNFHTVEDCPLNRETGEREGAANGE